MTVLCYSVLVTIHTCQYQAAFIGFSAAIIIGVLDLENTSPYEEIASLGLGLAFGMVIAVVIYTSKYASKIRAFKRRLLKREN